MHKCVVTLFLCACLANAGELQMPPAGYVQAAPKTHRRARPRRLLWKASVALLVASQVVDAQSSWGYNEGNALLQSPSGTFGGKAVGIKFGMAAAVVAAQWVAHRKGLDPVEASSAANFAMAAVTAGYAARNYQIRSQCSH
jgi:hypothetical protein